MEPDVGSWWDPCCKASLLLYVLVSSCGTQCGFRVGSMLRTITFMTCFGKILWISTWVPCGSHDANLFFYGVFSQLLPVCHGRLSCQWECCNQGKDMLIEAPKLYDICERKRHKCWTQVTILRWLASHRTIQLGFYTQRSPCIYACKVLTDSS